MRKKIAVDNLSIGMLVCALDRPWLESPFGIAPFVIDSTDCLLRVRSHCEFVFVDGLTGPVTDAERDPNLSATFDRPELELEMLRCYAQHSDTSDHYLDQCSLEQELPAALDSYVHLYDTMSALFPSVRQGIAIDFDALRASLKPVVESILRNPDALIWRTRGQMGGESLTAHSMRLCTRTLAFGRHLGKDANELEALGLGALLHDVGMMRLSETLANVPDKTEQDSHFLTRHVEYGTAILAGIPDLAPTTMEFVREHHAYLDGGGFPKTASPSTVSPGGRIATIVHEYDRLSRPHYPQGALPEHLALKILYRDRGTRFDTKILEEFVRCVGIYPLGSVVELIGGEIGVVLSMNRERRLRPRIALTPIHTGTEDRTPPSLDIHALLAAPSTECEIARLADEQIHNRIQPLNYMPIPR